MPSSPTQLASASRWGVLATSSLAVFIVIVNNLATAAALSAIGHSLGLSTSTLSWVLTAGLLATGAFVLVAGVLGDRLGPRVTMLTGAAVFSVGSLVTCTADTATALIVGRALAGVGAAFLYVPSVGILRRAFSKVEIGRALGIWGAAGGLAYAVASLYGGLITDHLGWRAVFGIELALLAAIAVLTWAYLRGPSPGSRARRLDLIGAVLLAAGMILIVVACERGQAWGWASARIIGMLAAAVVVVVVFIWHQRRSDSPLINLALFRNRAFVASTLTVFAAGLGISVYFLFNLYVQSDVLLDLSATKAGLMLVPFGVTMAIFAFAGGKLADRIGYRIPVALALIVSATGFFVFSRVTVTTGVVFLFLPLMLVGVGLGLSQAIGRAAGMAEVTQEEAGQASGTLSTFLYIGASMSVAIATTIWIPVAMSDVNESLEAVDVPRLEEAALDRALVGSPDKIESTAQTLPADQQAAFVDGVREGAINGFSAVMIFLMLVALVIAATSAWLLRPPARALRPEDKEDDVLLMEEA